MNQDTKPTSSRPAFVSGRLKIYRPDLTRLGDKVAAVAQPIAKAIDRVAGTDIQNCGGCKQRKEALNRWGREHSPQSQTSDSGD